jgi:hypothetical protein
MHGATLGPPLLGPQTNSELWEAEEIDLKMLTIIDLQIE